MPCGEWPSLEPLGALGTTILNTQVAWNWLTIIFGGNNLVKIRKVFEEWEDFSRFDVVNSSLQLILSRYCGVVS